MYFSCSQNLTLDGALGFFSGCVCVTSLFPWLLLMNFNKDFIRQFFFFNFLSYDMSKNCKSLVMFQLYAVVLVFP